jgi:aspartate aminotransferase
MAKPSFSQFADSVVMESAFDVLATARELQAQGKDVIELEIGDSPFRSSTSATSAGIRAIEEDACHYGPSQGLPDFRAAAAEYLNTEYGTQLDGKHIVAGPGAKTFETLFAEAFVNPGEEVLVFTPHFPTYPPNIARRGATMRLSALRVANDFRPNLDDVARFLDDGGRAIFLNSPHNPTGGVATKDDIVGLANLVRGRDAIVLSDEPYDRMTWHDQHHTLLAQPDMLDHCVAAYTFSKSYSMSGWRLGFAASSSRNIDMLTKLTNTCLSCVPPFTQIAGAAALRNDREERDKRLQVFGDRVAELADAIDKIDGIHCKRPAGTFYVFPSVAELCNELGITSHGLAMYLLEAADDARGVACLGGECFGDAGKGFLRMSCAEPKERLLEAVEFLAEGVKREDRVTKFLADRPRFCLAETYTL